ncbi:hypothetical protein GCM10009798_41870 [Nocardioides panacihumi]|uniref:Uncharacterized protein n=1 Tax=Nocardioides panacihumi TaxID=400774 RepID=A0ABN2RWT1_9ACTN
MITRAVIGLLAELAGRPEWGRAMLAEAEQISDPRARRRFARGCLWALALSVPAGVGTLLVAGLSSLTVVVVALVRYPGIVSGAGTWVAVGLFSIVVVGYVTIGAGLAARLGRGGPTGQMLASGAVIAGVWMVALVASGTPAGISIPLLALAPCVALILGWRATRRSTSTTIGLRCVGLAALAGGLGLFLVWGGETVILAGRPYDPGMVRDFATSGAPDLATYAVGDSLGSGMMLLLLVPLVSLVAGATGAMAAAHWPRTSHTDA